MKGKHTVMCMCLNGGELTTAESVFARMSRTTSWFYRGVVRMNNLKQIIVKIRDTRHILKHNSWTQFIAFAINWIILSFYI